MCLAVPSKIVEIKNPHSSSTEEENNSTASQAGTSPPELAIVETLGVRREAIIALLDEKVEIGDYVLLHAGFAIRKINLQEALKTIQMHEEAMKIK